MTIDDKYSFDTMMEKTIKYILSKHNISFKTNRYSHWI